MSLAIEVKNLERIYGAGEKKVVALNQLNLEVHAGKFVALKGRSGSGKTTLLNCIGGLDQPTAGEIHVFGQELTNLDDKQRTQWRREHVGFIFQSFGLLPTFSAYENVEFMLRIAQIPKKDRRERARHCLNIVGLEKWMGHRPYEMSGGQQQRLAIARAISTEPKLILADEATGELDSETARVILALFRQIVESEGVTVLGSTHDNLVDEYVDEIVNLYDGAIQNE